MIFSNLAQIISSQQLTVNESETFTLSVSSYPNNIFQARVLKGSLLFYPAPTVNPRVNASVDGGAPNYFGSSFYFQLQNITMNDTGVFRMEITGVTSSVTTYNFQVTIQGKT